MIDLSIPQILLVTLVLTGVAFFVLAWILWIQLPALTQVFLKWGRLSLAKIGLRNRIPIVDPRHQERSARNIEGDVLYFE